MWLRARFATDVQLYGYVEGGVDWWDTLFRIPPQFTDADDFSADLGCVKQGGKYGYIDATGQWVIPPQFDQAQPFREGRAVVALEGTYGYIDRQGHVCIAPQFEAAGDFQCRVARAKSGGRWGYIDDQGTWVIPPQFDFAWDFDASDHAYVAREGHYARITSEGIVWSWSKALTDWMPYHLAMPSWRDFIGYE
jgi:hypothetical protein